MDWFQSPAFRLRAEHLMRIHNVPGFSIAILQDHHVASLGFGHAVLDPPTPCTPDTLFDIASSSKSFTGVSVALLVEDEEDEKCKDVKWDTPVSKILPDDFVMPEEEYTKSVTVDDIVSHRTGMPRHDLSYMGPNAEHPDNARSVTRSLRYLPLNAPLRTKYQYNNMMFTVAAHLVSDVSQRSFPDFVNERIFRPLGMASTSLQPSQAVSRGFSDRLAMGYCWDKKKKKYNAVPAPECQEGEGAGSIITSANDFIKWVKALVHREGPISETVYQELVRQRSFANPSSKSLRPFTSPTFYGAGVEVYYYRGHAVVTHDGWIDGFCSNFAFFPDLDFGVAACGNSDGAGTVARILKRELMDEFLKIPMEERSYRVVKHKPRTSKKDDSPVIRLKPQQEETQLQPLINGEEASKASQSPPGDTLEDDDLHGPSDVSDTDEVDGEAGSKDDKEDCSRAEDMQLEAYTGTFQHPGYHRMTVQIRNKQLFVDATDRSFPFTVTLEEKSGGTKFRATLLEEERLVDETVDAEFVLNDDRMAVRMGLKLEPALEDLIWFDRIQ